MKLYWRIKKAGKWTWIPANVIDDDERTAFPENLGYTIVHYDAEEEEEE